VGKLAGVFDSPPTRQVCRFADLLDSLDVEDRAALTEAVFDSGLSVNFISEQVTEALGQSLSRSVIQRHKVRPCLECVRRGYVFAR
jgi:hypothetical protein